MPTVKPTTQIGDEVRPMTDDEHKQWLFVAQELQEQTEAKTAKAEAKASALAKLGLTADEAAALFG
jgi:hypothetical protein